MTPRWRVTRRHHQYAFDARQQPVLTVPDGACVVFETLDCFGNRITEASQRFATEAELLAVVGEYNPVAGPVAVHGAGPGDLLEIEIIRIELGTYAPYAVTTVFGTGSRIGAAECPDLPGQGHTRVCPIIGDRVLFPLGERVLPLPVRPMVGTVGTAPAGAPVPSLHYGPHGGNMDCPLVTEGAVLRLPVHVAGARVSLGDVHAGMGDGEITSTALETSADVTVRLRVRRGAAAGVSSRPSDGPTPQLDDAQRIGVIGAVPGESVSGNIEAAMRALHARLLREYGFASVDAYDLLGATAQIRVGQCVAGGWASVYVGIERRLLAPA